MATGSYGDPRVLHSTTVKVSNEGAGATLSAWWMCARASLSVWWRCARASLSAWWMCAGVTDGCLDVWNFNSGTFEILKRSRKDAALR